MAVRVGGDSLHFFREPTTSDNEDIIRRGRACVRLIEAVDVLLQRQLDQHELVMLQGARRLAVQQIQQLVRDRDPFIAAQIMAASDKRLGTVNDVMLN